MNNLLFWEITPNLDNRARSVILDLVNATADAIDLAEFPFVQDLPKRERNRLQTVWDVWQEVKAKVEEKGLFIPVTMAASLGGVSRQRIYQLCESGTLEQIEVGKNTFITENSLMSWMESERKAGRPFSHIPEGTIGQVKFAAKVAIEVGGETRAGLEAGRK